MANASSDKNTELLPFLQNLLAQHRATGALNFPPPLQIPDKSLLARTKNEQRIARSTVTRTTNQALACIESATESLVSLNALKRQKLALQEAKTNLTAIFTSYTDVLMRGEIDEAIVEREYNTHDEYIVKSSDALAELDAKIDTVSVALGFDISIPVTQALYTPEQTAGEQDYSEGYADPQQLHFQSNELESSGAYGEQSHRAAPHTETPTSEEGRALESGGARQSDQLFEKMLYMAQNPADKIPVFKGDPTQFHEWWNLLHYYVDSQPIDETEKCRIIKNSIQGKAARFVQHLPVCGESYEFIKTTMQRRYGQSAQAQTAHIQKIHQLCTWKDLDKNDKFADFLSLLAQHVNALLVLGYSYESLTAALSPIILACIPQTHRIRFNSIWRKSQTESACQLQSLMLFLDEQSMLLEESSLQEKFSLVNIGNKQQQHKNKSKFSKDKKGKSSKEDSDRNQAANFSFGANVSSKVSCLFCEKDHASTKCTKKMPPEERRKRVASVNGCLRCLRKNHDIKKCRSKAENCSKCSEKHNVLVCLKKDTEPQVVSAVSSTSQSQSDGTAQTLVQTAYAWVVNGEKKIMCRILLDPGSQVSFISKRITQALGLSALISQNVTINGVAGQQRSEEHVETVKVKIRGRFSGSEIEIACLSVQKIMQGVLPRAVPPIGFDQVADQKEPGFPEEIDVLIGANWLHLIYAGMYKKVGSLTASPTKLGWVFWGDSSKINIKSSVATSLACIQILKEKSTAAPKRQKHPSNREDIDFLWNTEFLGIDDASSDEDKSARLQAEKFFRESIERSVDGRYIVSLPFKENKAALGSNEKLAYSCLKSFLKRYRNKPETLAAVDKEIMKLIDSGAVELAEPRKEGEQAHYLPLLVVAKKSLSPSAEARVRVVKDGGARSQDEASLNDVLEKGPNCLPDIVFALLNFRRRSIAILCDVERAFHQLLISKNHRTFLRFFWAPGVSTNPDAPIKQYWGTVLDFGLISSPWLYCATVKHHLDREIEAHPEREKLLKEVQKSCYMDDVQVGANSLDEAKIAVDWIVDSFSSGRFPLNKWATNCAELEEYIRRSQSQGTQIAADVDNYKFLGVPWRLQEDTLHIEVSRTSEFLSAGVPTKRRLLKGLSQIFDPLGQIASIAIGLKVILQQLWSRQLDWDAPLSGDLEEKYNAAVANLSHTDSIRVDRTLFASHRDHEQSRPRELHVFADASLKAYGSIAYIREPLPNLKGKAVVKFVMAKGRVAPLAGRWTIHRLELMAAVIATRVASKIKESLPGEIDRTVMYSDNSAVLGWVRDRPERWKPFVANRIREIHASSSPESWSYIKSCENPADLLSRCSPLDTPSLRHFWLHGPPWLSSGKPEVEPRSEEQEIPAEVRTECKAEICAAATITADTARTLIEKEFSSWSKTVRIVAFVRRFIDTRIRRKPVPKEKYINAAEYKEAEKCLLRSIQRKNFGPEMVKNCVDLPRSSALFRLSPFIDSEGFVRCRTRLEKASFMPQDEKTPIILPGDDFGVQLLVRDIHEHECRHTGGLSGVLHEIRKHYLVTSARRTAKKAIHGCKVCARYRAKAASLPLPPLPAFRVDQCPPFSTTAVDHAGPVYYKNEFTNTVQKSYLLLFVCAVTRAIRIELVADLSTNEFLLALRRFVSRNPAVTRLVSDNARSFKKAEKEIAIWFNSAKKAEVNDFLTRKKIEWIYSVAKGPWQGAFWERMVSCVKRPLRKLLQTHKPSFRHLEAALMEIEQIVNDRPISAVTTDPDEPRALSPSQLMYGYTSQPNLPELPRMVKDVEAAKAIIFTERWRHQQSLLRCFWKQFRQEYLQYLRTLHYNNPQGNRPLRVGQICILQSHEPSRAYWPLCRVIELLGGRRTDGKQRSCKILTAEGKILARPIQLLFPLEIEQF